MLDKTMDKLADLFDGTDLSSDVELIRCSACGSTNILLTRMCEANLYLHQTTKGLVHYETEVFPLEGHSILCRCKECYEETKVDALPESLVLSLQENTNHVV